MNEMNHIISFSKRYCFEHVDDTLDNSGVLLLPLVEGGWEFRSIKTVPGSEI